MNRFEPATVQIFRAAYDRLSRESKCDEPGEDEYHRVLEEWQAVGCPMEGLDNFIVTNANKIPGLDGKFHGRESQN